MSKREQIEELASEIEKRLECAKSVVGSMNKGIGYWIAEDLVSKGYMKINEFPTVIDGFKTDYAYRQIQAKELSDKVCKETAKKIYEELKDMSVRTDGITGQYEVVSIGRIKSVCEKYDAGYKQEKEVVKELLKDVGNITIIDGDGEVFCLKDIDSFRKICKKYGAIIEDEIPNIEEIF